MINENEITSQFELLCKPHFEIEKGNLFSDRNPEEYTSKKLKPHSKLIAPKNVTFYGICRVMNNKGVF